MLCTSSNIGMLYTHMDRINEHGWGHAPPCCPLHDPPRSDPLHAQLRYNQVMDLDKLPHFSSSGGANQPQESLRRQSQGNKDPDLARLSACTPKPRSSKAGDWRLAFPHNDARPVPSYMEEIQDVQQLFTRKMKA